MRLIISFSPFIYYTFPQFKPYKEEVGMKSLVTIFLPAGASEEDEG
tara:strand:+ start:714 stop:851 length:138 start_codon:yes stop_codon:yes gene_type:complete